MHGKSIVILAALSFGCGGSQSQHKYPPPTNNIEAQKATQKDCDEVYQRVVELQAKNIANYPTEKEKQVLRWLVDKQYTESGAKDRFMATCLSSMSVMETNCDKSVQTLDDMNNCTKFLPKWSR